jgi:putative endonuclease
LSKQFYVYMVSNQHRNVLYTGVTSDLVARAYIHRNELVDGFTKRYKAHDLVWYEQHETAESAIVREKRIKKWRRAWKDELVSAMNPAWLDLYDEIAEP